MSGHAQPIPGPHGIAQRFLARVSPGVDPSPANLYTARRFIAFLHAGADAAQGAAIAPEPVSGVLRAPCAATRFGVMTVKSVVLRITLGQFAVSLFCALVWLGVAGSAEAVAALTGALVAIVPWLAFAIRVMSRGPGATPASMLSAFYLGGVLKFVLTMVLFAVALVFHAERFAPLITTFVAVLAVHWLALLDLSRGLIEKK